ncbi:hypothetical protein INR49_017056 [Caranx melampygus]|nr:hypothetical protein INR49_017056 [Caranx melampygus]
MSEENPNNEAADAKDDNRSRKKTSSGPQLKEDDHRSRKMTSRGPELKTAPNMTRR